MPRSLPRRQTAESRPFADLAPPYAAPAAADKLQAPAVLCPFVQYAHRPALADNVRQAVQSHSAARSDIPESRPHTGIAPKAGSPTENAPRTAYDQARLLSSAKTRSAESPPRDLVPASLSTNSSHSNR